MTVDPILDAYLRIVEDCREIDNRFVQIRRIGADGGGGYFSMVFTAVDTRSNQAVALKIFRPDRAGDIYRTESFQREAELLQKLQGQEGIVQPITPLSQFTLVATFGGLTVPMPFQFYAVELADRSVAAQIEQGIWKAEEKILAFHAMAKAIQRIHARRIVHRDIKPSNFLKMVNGSIKLSDFGTGRDLASSAPALVNRYTGPPGDVTYAAPELFACLHDVDPEVSMLADIFSLGATLFELFTGTVLGLQIYDFALLGILQQTMLAVNKSDRRRVYEQSLPSIVTRHPLPSMSTASPAIPGSIRQRLDNLYRELCAIDYRMRLTDFDKIFRQTQNCLLILRNEEKYQKWRQERVRRRDARRNKAGVSND